MKVSQLQLVYGQETVVPVEINVQSIRVALQNKLSQENYGEALIHNLSELDDIKLDVINQLEVEK